MILTLFYMDFVHSHPSPLSLETTTFFSQIISLWFKFP